MKHGILERCCAQDRPNIMQNISKELDALQDEILAAATDNGMLTSKDAAVLLLILYPFVDQLYQLMDQDPSAKTLFCLLHARFHPTIRTALTEEVKGHV